MGCPATRRHWDGGGCGSGVMFIVTPLGSDEPLQIEVIPLPSLLETVRVAGS